MMDKQLIELLKAGKQEEASSYYTAQTGEQDIMVTARYLVNLIENMSPQDKLITKENLRANRKGCAKLFFFIIFAVVVSGLLLI